MARKNYLSVRDETISCAHNFCFKSRQSRLWFDKLRGHQSAVGLQLTIPRLFFITHPPTLCFLSVLELTSNSRTEKVCSWRWVGPKTPGWLDDCTNTKLHKCLWCITVLCRRICLYYLLQVLVTHHSSLNSNKLNCSTHHKTCDRLKRTRWNPKHNMVVITKIPIKTQVVVFGGI